MSVESSAKSQDYKDTIMKLDTCLKQSGIIVYFSPFRLVAVLPARGCSNMRAVISRSRVCSLG